MISRSTVATSRAPPSSCTPLLTGETAAGASRVASRSSAGVNTTKPYAASMSSWTTWLLNTTMPTNLTLTSSLAADVRLANRPRCMTSTDVQSELAGRARVHHGLVGAVRARQPPVHHSEPVLLEEFAVGARDREDLVRDQVHIGCSVGIRECDLRDVDAVDPFHAGQACDLGFQLRHRPAVGVEQRDREVGRVRAREELRVRRLRPPRARDRAQRDPPGQSDQHDDRDVPAEPPAERRAEAVPRDPPHCSHGAKSGRAPGADQGCQPAR